MIVYDWIVHLHSSLWQPPNCITVCLCVSVAFGVSLWSNKGDNDMNQPILNYNYVVSLDVGWNVGLGEMHPYMHILNIPNPQSVSLRV